MRRTGHLVDEQTPVRRLVIDPVACDGIGICAYLAPGLVWLDRWGYPITARTPLDGRDLRAAKAA
ncbi:MAG TPA: hypothetical protein VFO77_08590, partial [Actinoplanes sp.]|nr:hypothetical protein [Actinoplanes sp.]